MTVTACAGGKAESMKGAGLTTSLTVVISVTPALVPSMVMVKSPGVEQAGTVIVDEPEPTVMEAGLKVTAAQPVGAPVARRSMFPLKPFNGAAVTV